MAELDRQALRNEIRFLGEQLGTVIRQIDGEEAFRAVERVRHLARDFRHGDRRARDQLADVIAGLSRSQLCVVIRAFAIFLNLANLAEDRHRIRVLRHRRLTNVDGVAKESIHDAIRTLSNQRVDSEGMARLIGQLDVELVFTAHPTEAKRRSVRAKLRHLRRSLGELDQELLPTERQRVEERIRNELVKLWQTNLARPQRPTLMQEVERGLSIKRVLWDTLPSVLLDCRDALSAEYPQAAVDVERVLRYGSWIGGDRDGHPGVTSEVSEKTIHWLAAQAIEFHQEDCQRLRGSLSLSSQYTVGSDNLKDQLRQRLTQWPQLQRQLETVPASEPYRRWLTTIGWRLEQTLGSLVGETRQDGCYVSARQLADDVLKIRDGLSGSTNALAVRHEVQPWLDRISAFGLHLARLDIRQEAAVHRRCVDQLLRSSGICEAPEALDEQQRVSLLTHCLGEPDGVAAARDLPPDEGTRDTIDLMRWLSDAVDHRGYESFGGYVISMSRHPSDLLHVLWLWNVARGNQLACLPLIPLFETIDDLENADRTWAASLNNPIYRAHLAHYDNRQTIMLGYSDGTKDGGFVAANWALFDAQRRLTDVAKQNDVQLVFFHGRGGSLGRGGGPAARSILALPKETFYGQLRLTEQGEVLAERYDDPQIASRHLEQILWASLLAAAGQRPAAQPLWLEIMSWLAGQSRTAYRQLIDNPGFVDFFRRTTPLEVIESLPIGSRPARRATSSGLDGLRAIPFVFSWTQCRWLVPAWYGLGAAVTALRQSNADWHAELKVMYEQWPFFRAVIDNATLALAKADPSIGNLYGQLAADDPRMQSICTSIGQEYETTRDVVLQITATDELLQRVSWLQESIEVRNYYTDPLNMIQVELLRRLQAGEDPGQADDIQSLLYLTRLSINGVASGMRTTG